MLTKLKLKNLARTKRQLEAAPDDKLSFPADGWPAHLADGLRIYAIGDIHGRADLLRKAFLAIDADLQKRPIARSVEIILGDMIDRGPDSASVIDQILDRRQLRQLIALSGNHEEMMMSSLANPMGIDRWIENGGLDTLRSYGVKFRKETSEDTPEAIVALAINAIPTSHVHFMLELSESVQCGDYFFTHAGIKPGVPLADQQKQDLRWIRSEFLDSEDNFGAIIVHGHTPVPEPEVRHNRINLDTGAYMTGRLTCLVLEANMLGFINIRS